MIPTYIDPSIKDSTSGFKPINLTEFRKELMYALVESGVRVSHRSQHFSFDEPEAEIMLDMISSEEHGLSIGDAVRVDGNYVVPWQYLTSADEADWDGYVLQNQLFRILTFFKLKGRIKRGLGRSLKKGASVHVEGLFCALISLGSPGDTIPFLCRGQELSNHTQKLREDDGKVNLYWIGCLEKSKF